MVKKRYGRQVRQEAAGELIASTYEQALQQENLKPAGEPSIEQAKNAEQWSLSMYTATFEIFPEVSIKQPDSLISPSKRRLSAEISDADLDAMLETLRKQRTTWVDGDKAASKEVPIWTIDFAGTLDGEAFSKVGKADDYPVVLGYRPVAPGP